MNSPERAGEFVDYIAAQLRFVHKPPGFDLVTYLNNVLASTEGYEDYFLVKHPETGSYGMYQYSTLPDEVKDLIKEVE